MLTELMLFTSKPFCQKTIRICGPNVCLYLTLWKRKRERAWRWKRERETFGVNEVQICKIWAFSALKYSTGRENHLEMNWNFHFFLLPSLTNNNIKGKNTLIQQWSMSKEKYAVHLDMHGKCLRLMLTLGSHLHTHIHRVWCSFLVNFNHHVHFFFW